ncbi:DUF2612 domain-containing protein [Pseudomonas resinovorans]|uniref:DUF2612 domain-containing protein n=1 Tax=Metapseudomonas resinovorans TaxID=53412 RepID=A0ABT4YAC7_METRE|nr:DUF2612 domain-containing protein [Pseudomonas resinovorans]MDA8485838.1 DUF2612 domain-containing protein [Pseudomonas resinovorans]
MTTFCETGGYVQPGYVAPGYVYAGVPSFVNDTLQSQYSSSPRIQKLLCGMGKQLDASRDIDLFMSKIFDISTAEGWGLDNWGRILGLDRTVLITSTAAFGFSGSGLQPFDQQPFDSGGLASAVTLPDEDYRKLLMLKAASNISGSTIPIINKILSVIFKGRGDVFVLETGVMRIQYTFKFIMTPFERLIMRFDWMVPRPGCVTFTWVEEPI